MMRGVVRSLVAALLAAAIPVGPGPATAAPHTTAPAVEMAPAITRFLDGYVDDDGRVVRRDQGGDTVSEGQAYALVLSASIGDEATFRSVWAWTTANLVGPDGLLAVRWDGGIVDSMPATDADLVAAAALAIAGERFGDGELTAASTRIGERILRLEADGDLLLPGPWAAGTGVVNPGYFVFPAMSVLWNGDAAWGPVAARSRRVLAELMADPPHLPPDWASARDAPSAAPAPGGAGPRSGYEAARVLLHLDADCDAQGRALAADAWPFLHDEAAAGAVEAVRALDGTPLVDYEHPAALVAAAASADAAGDTGAADDLLRRATELDAAAPSYYGAAMVALGSLWIGTWPQRCG